MTERQSRTQGASASAWSFIAGEKGRNRIRVFERLGHGLWIDYRDDTGKRVRQPLGHSDRERGKLEAEEIAAKFRRHGAAPPATMTLSRLIDNYEKEVVPRKAASTQAHNRRAFKLFLKAFGARRRPATLNRRDWDSYIERRRSGELAHPDRKGEAVRSAVIEQDCRLLLAVLNWATRAGDGAGGYLLERNPLSGLDVPREESPRRPVATREQFDAFVKAAAGTPQIVCFAVLAWYTGHRGKSIRNLRWSDIDIEGARIHWRGDVDKIGYDHWNPLHAEAVTVLRRERARVSAIGDTFLFPGDDPKESIARETVSHWWTRFAEAAKIPDGEGYGWHSFRRAFANTLRAVPLRDLKDLGGWKTTKTVVQVYQQPSEPAQRQGLEALTLAPNGPKSPEMSTERAQGTGTS